MSKHPKDTAIKRTGPSAPLRWLLKTGYLSPWARDVGGSGKPATHLDYGCGHGADVRHLRELGYDAHGYDPNWPENSTLSDGFVRYPPVAFDVVLCTYVLNVIRDKHERDEALAMINVLTKPGGVAFVTVRRDLDGDTESQRVIHLDFPSIVAGTGFEIYRIDKPATA